jgi:aconitase B
VWDIRRKTSEDLEKEESFNIWGSNQTMGMTVVEKILARATGLGVVISGDVVEPKADLAMSHENAALVINQFLEIYKEIGAEDVGSFKGRDHF